jgi:pimeloyl-ACP methyl ester carboxylesterase
MTKTATDTRYVTSADGTRIAYDVTGTGPTLVVVDGAMCRREMGPGQMLAPSLAEKFEVVVYDRRGRGDSGDTQPYDVQREVEDLVAVLDAVGPDAYVFGSSSGAVLALEAARQGVPMRKLVCYEAPFIVDGTHAPNPSDLADQLAGLVEAGRRSAAVKLFLRTVGVPAPVRVLMPLLPMWKGLTSVAHTLPYDTSFVISFQQGAPLPAAYYAAVVADTVVIAGGKSPAYLQNAQAALVARLPSARLVTLTGQTHMVKPKATVPVLLEHFGS